MHLDIDFPSLNALESYGINMRDGHFAPRRNGA
jgi:hypothetical protein